MQQFLQGINLQIVLIVLFFGFSALTWVVRKLKEQAEIRRRQQILERQKFEALRTGRIETGPAPVASGAQAPERRLAEMAARRAEQMRQGGLVPSPTQTRPLPPRTPQAPRQPQRAATRAPMPRPVGATPSSAPRPVARAPLPGQAKSTAQRRQEMLEARRRALEARARAEQPEPRPTPRAVVQPPVRVRTPDPVAPAPTIRPHLDHASLRRAMVLKEILDPPIALRGEAGL